MGTKMQRGQKRVAETSPRGGSAPSFGSELEIMGNLTSDFRTMRMQAGPHRISTTAHLVHLHDAEGKGLLLGVAHIRRGVGDCLNKLCTPFKDSNLADAPPFLGVITTRTYFT